MVKQVNYVLEVLNRAKLAGHKASDNRMYGYYFRTNEQAAEKAIQALDQAGYEVVIKGHPITAEQAIDAIGIPDLIAALIRKGVLVNVGQDGNTVHYDMTLRRRDIMEIVRDGG